MTQEQLIARFNMQPHPEGGYYTETYRSELTIQSHQPNEMRSASTAIYFLLTAGNFSALHRIKSDEIWHFYLGDAIEVVELSEDGQWRVTRLGNDIEAGEVPQYMVKAGHWFGSRVLPGKQFGLVGCTVAPGFDFADFELASRESLISDFPEWENEIITWTR